MANLDHELRSYDQLCQSYRAIDEFRAKLLGLLPLVSATGIGILLDKLPLASCGGADAQNLLGGLGVFGALITLGLFVSEIYGTKKCGALIEAGRKSEILLGIENGRFRTRPPNAAYILDEPFAAGIVYPTVLAAWTFLTLAFLWDRGNPVIPILVLGSGLAGTLTRAALLAAKRAEQNSPRKET